MNEVKFEALVELSREAERSGINDTIFRNRVHNLNNLKVTVGSSATEACRSNYTSELALGYNIRG